MEEIKQLTPEQINKFCDDVIYRLKTYKKYCLCFALKCYLASKDIYYLFDYDMGYLFIPEFTNKNAVEYANAETVDSNEKPWWPVDYINFDFNNRILFLEWIKSQYPLTPEENITPEK